MKQRLTLIYKRSKYLSILRKPNNSYLKWPIGSSSDSVNRVNDMKSIE